MIELGELEGRHQDFDRRNARVVAVSLEGREEAQKTQADFPHLVIMSDQDRKLSSAVDVIQPNSGPGGGDTSVPTTILIDREGRVCWLLRPESVLRRLSPDEVLAALDRNCPAAP